MVDMGREEFRVEAGMAKKNSQAIQERIEDLQANLQELSAACPFHLANPKDCPLFPLRKMEPRKRLQWCNALTEDDLGYLAAYHRVCLTIRVESGLAKLRTRTLARRGKRARGRSGR